MILGVAWQGRLQTQDPCRQINAKIFSAFGMTRPVRALSIFEQAVGHCIIEGNESWPPASAVRAILRITL
jgi:hypothetical protein